MSKIYTLLIGMVFSSAIINAQDAPALALSYTTIIIKSNNEIVANKTVGLRISILQHSAKGMPIYSQTLSPKTNDNGQIDIEIGVGKEFSSIDWSIDKYFLKTEVDIKGGTAYKTMSVTQFLSVPYAMYAGKSGFAFTADYNTLSNKPDLFDGTWTSLAGKPSTIAGYLNTDADSAAGFKTNDDNENHAGTISASSHKLTNVTDPVDAQDAATKSYVDELREKLEALLERVAKLEGAGRKAITDRDYNIYNSVTIGTQTWFAENLKTTRYNDGTPIADVTDNIKWANLTTPGYCYYNNDNLTAKNTYGALYNWYAVITDKLCPAGWYVPTDEEWTTLTNYLGGAIGTGGKLKETDIKLWNYPIEGATNETGFRALPGGFRKINNTALFSSVLNKATWWTSTEFSSTAARSISVYSFEPDIMKENILNNSGLSVRCVKN